MPFNIAQILGGWRRKDGKARKTSGSGREKNRGIPSSIPSLSKGGGEEVGSSASEKSKFIAEEPKAYSAPKQFKNKGGLAWKLIESPHISEKATMLGEGKYVFRIADTANKPLLKNAIENRYGVKVASINILQGRDKKRRRGAVTGIKQGFKKAVVTLEAGQSISEF